VTTPCSIDPLFHYDPDNPYPDSDGRPMADNTLQFEWIVKIKENLEILFADRSDVFVAGDLLWYPEADRQVAGPVAPDVLVAFGRPKGYRGSYKQWEEGGQPPQVVFEVLSPSNSTQEMRNKRDLYEQYGVDEYYVFDPDHDRLEVWLRQGGRLVAMSHIKGFTSPRLGIRFELRGDGLTIFNPDGSPFRTPVELARHAEQQTVRAEQAVARAEQEAARAVHEAARAEQEAARAERLAARLRELGLDPDAP
jgi:Uma2 family endonuclease